MRLSQSNLGKAAIRPSVPLSAVASVNVRRAPLRPRNAHAQQRPRRTQNHVRRVPDRPSLTGLARLRRYGPGSESTPTCCRALAWSGGCASRMPPRVPSCTITGTSIGQESRSPTGPSSAMAFVCGGWRPKTMSALFVQTTLNHAAPKSNPGGIPSWARRCDATAGRCTRSRCSLTYCTRPAECDLNDTTYERVVSSIYA